MRQHFPLPHGLCRYGQSDSGRYERPRALSGTPRNPPGICFNPGMASSLARAVSIYVGVPGRRDPGNPLRCGRHGCGLYRHACPSPSLPRSGLSSHTFSIHLSRFHPGDFPPFTLQRTFFSRLTGVTQKFFYIFFESASFAPQLS